MDSCDAFCEIIGKSINKIDLENKQNVSFRRCFFNELLHGEQEKFNDDKTSLYLVEIFQKKCLNVNYTNEVFCNFFAQISQNLVKLKKGY